MFAEGKAHKPPLRFVVSYRIDDDTTQKLISRSIETGFKPEQIARFALKKFLAESTQSEGQDMSKPFFYRLNAADFYSKIRSMTKKERAEWVISFALDLVACNSQDEFTLKMIEESKIFIKKKSEAGKKGMDSRYGKT